MLPNDMQEKTCAARRGRTVLRVPTAIVTGAIGAPRQPSALKFSWCLGDQPTVSHCPRQEREHLTFSNSGPRWRDCTLPLRVHTPKHVISACGSGSPGGAYGLAFSKLRRFRPCSAFPSRVSGR